MKHRKSNLWIYLTVALVLLGYLIFMLANVFIVRNQLRQFAIDYSDSIQYGIDNECLTAEYNGEVTRIIEKNANALFRSVANSGYERFRDDYDKETVISFDFGNGDRMWLYPYDSSTMVIRYVYDDGKERVYITNESTMLVTFERLISTKWGNLLLEQE